MKRLFSKLPTLVLALMVGLIASSSAFGSATIVIQNVDAANVGFNDPTPVAPVGGNNGTTLGQQRLNAFQFAADIWGATLTSGPSITIRASWSTTMPCTETSATLGTAGATNIQRNFTGAPFANTWYGVSLANALSNTDLNQSNAEISAQFNADLGKPGCLENSHWYYGFDNNHGVAGIDLVTVLLHEFSHGLGFQSYTDPETGQQAGSSGSGFFPSIYDRFLFDNSTSKTWAQMNDSERVASAVNGGNLAWNGPRVDADAVLLSSGKDSSGRPLLYTPNPVSSGSSVSHWAKTATPNQLMEPDISNNLTHSVTPPQDLTFSLLRDTGWCSGCPQPPPPSPTPTPSPPPNNNLASAQLISGCSGSVNGTNVGANKEPGEGSHSPDGDGGGGSVWYRWQAPSSGSVTMTTDGSDYDTLLAVYTGNSFPLTLIVSNDDVDPGVVRTSTVTFNATAGTIYKIAVDGWGGEVGNIVLNWSESGCKTDQTITFPALTNKVYGNPPFTVSATASSGLPVSFSIVSGPATISGSTVTITGVGTVTIRASQAGNATYNAATPVDRSFTVSKANQTITFNALVNKTFGDPPFNVSASSSSGLPVSFSIVSGPATISGNTVSITGVGVVTVRASQAGNANYNPATSVDRSFTVQAAAVQFGASSYTVGEGGGSAQIIVSRTNTSGAATVQFATSDTAGLNECNFFNGVASSRCDYATSIGTLRFAATQGSKTIFIPIVDDSYAEGNETFTITLSNPTGTTLGSITTANITIQDNDSVTGPNPIDGVDFFIRQHYIDFLGREPEPSGLQGWRNVLNNCPPSGKDANGNYCDRIEVSAGFFRSPEFQVRGYFIYRFYSAVGRIPLYGEFLPDFSKVSGFLSPSELEANKVAFVDEFMARTEFQNKYSSTFNNPTAYVNALLQTVGLPNHPSRSFWIAALTNGTMTRAQVLRSLVDSVEVYNKYYNEAFVIMQYFGYLRRTADGSYVNWIQTMTDTGGDYRIMINGFLNSNEYRRRFGPN